MVSLILLISMFLITSSIAKSPEEKMLLAVMDLQPVGIPEKTAVTVSDLIRTELFNTGLFRIIERSQMDQILKEQEFQMTGCTDTECAIQAGQLLGANKILIGTVNRLGEAFIINARIVDVERGEMEFAEKAKVASEAELDKGCEIFARKLAGMIKPKAAPTRAVKPTPEKVWVDERPGPEMKYNYPLRGLGYISAVVGILCAGTGLYFDYQTRQNSEAAETLYAEYRQAMSDFEAKWNAYRQKVELSNSQATVRNILYITSGVTIGFGLISVFIIRHPISETVSIGIRPDQIVFTYRF